MYPHESYLLPASARASYQIKDVARLDLGEIDLLPFIVEAQHEPTQDVQRGETPDSPSI